MISLRLRAELSSLRRGYAKVPEGSVGTPRRRDQTSTLVMTNVSIHSQLNDLWLRTGRRNFDNFWTCANNLSYHTKLLSNLGERHLGELIPREEARNANIGSHRKVHRDCLGHRSGTHDSTLKFGLKSGHRVERRRLLGGKAGRDNSVDGPGQAYGPPILLRRMPQSVQEKGSNRHADAGEDPSHMVKQSHIIATSCSSLT